MIRYWFDLSIHLILTNRVLVTICLRLIPTALAQKTSTEVYALIENGLSPGIINIITFANSNHYRDITKDCQVHLLDYNRYNYA